MDRDWINYFFVVLCLTGYSYCWHYEEQEKWGKICTEGKRQSPIGLSVDDAEEVVYTPFIWGVYETNVNAVVKNNGHSADVRFNIPPESRPEIKGGNLPNVYVLDHLHFHWSSEHTINGYRYPLELHMVHHAKQFPNVSTAVNHEFGVAVFAVLFDVSPDDNLGIKSLMEIIDTIKKDKETNHLTNFNIQKFIPQDTAGYYRYEGSLTTPECNEGILWTVFTNTLPISEQQVEIFRELETQGKKMSLNYRQLQPLNDRKIFLKVSPLHGGSMAPLPSLLAVLSVGFSIFFSTILVN